MDGHQDWTGYDYLKADFYTDAKEPLELYVEIRDTATTRLLDARQLHDRRPAGRRARSSCR